MAFVDRPDEVMVNPVVVSIGSDHGGRTRGGSIKIDEEGPRNSN